MQALPLNGGYPPDPAVPDRSRERRLRVDLSGSIGARWAAGVGRKPDVQGSKGDLPGGVDSRRSRGGFYTCHADVSPRQLAVPLDGSGGAIV